MMVDFENPSDSAQPVKMTLPPNAKIIGVVFTGIERLGEQLGIPVLCLLAGKWEILDTKQAGIAFMASIGFVLGGNYALRRAETKEDK